MFLGRIASESSCERDEIRRPSLLKLLSSGFDPIHLPSKLAGVFETICITTRALPQAMLNKAVGLKTINLQRFNSDFQACHVVNLALAETRKMQPRVVVDQNWSSLNLVICFRRFRWEQLLRIPVSFYSAVWPLSEEPLYLQMGLAGSWIIPNNSSPVPSSSSPAA